MWFFTIIFDKTNQCLKILDLKLSSSLQGKLTILIPFSGFYPKNSVLYVILWSHYKPVGQTNQEFKYRHINFFSHLVHDTSPLTTCRKKLRTWRKVHPKRCNLHSIKVQFSSKPGIWVWEISLCPTLLVILVNSM